MARTLAQWIGCQRVIKNAKHDELPYLLWLRKRAILSPSYTDPDPQEAGFPVDQTFSQFKSDLTPWLDQVPSQVLRNGATVHYRAWLNHWKNPGHFRRPRRKRRWEGNSVLLTRELFRFLEPGRVELGTAAHPVGVLAFVPHREIGTPGSITITRTRYGQWFLSYATDVLQGPELAKDEARLSELAGLPAGEVETLVEGLDRGIRFHAACSNGACYAMEAKAKRKIARLEGRRKHFQRAAARKRKGSRRREKALARSSRCSARIAAIREDFLRKTALGIARQAPLVMALEDLNLRGMARRAKPRPGPVAGTWLPNGAAAKTGLNKALANAGMGRFRIFLAQALAKMGKMLVLVPAAYSSQECSACGFIHPDNRPDQATFHCLACGSAENADVNAAKVIKKRGIALIRTAGTAGSARRGPARPGRPQGRGAIRRTGPEGPTAASVKRETSSFSRADARRREG